MYMEVKSLSRTPELPRETPQLIYSHAGESHSLVRSRSTPLYEIADENILPEVAMGKQHNNFCGLQAGDVR